MSDERPDRIIEGHEADGIQEYDNPMPRWWLTSFYVTIVFSAFYFVYMQMGGGGVSITDEFAAEQAHEQAMKPVVVEKMEATEEELLATYRTPAQLEAGKAVYKAMQCASCHGPEGQGLVGPNLTDDHWLLTDATLAGLFAVVRDGGRSGKGMIAWSTRLTREEIMSVVAYVASLHGSRPAHPKAPEGKETGSVSWQ